MFISFEGIDGSGKTTQIQLLKDYFVSTGLEVITLREPGGTIFSEKIRELLLSKDFVLNSFTELMLFEAARSYLTENIIKPALESNKVVLCDRFFDSTTAYQGYGRGMDKKFLTLCNQMAVSSVYPNITFYLNVQTEISRKRSEKKVADRIESAGDDFFSKVQNGFDELSKMFPERIKNIDANLSIEQVFNQIKIIIENNN
ncbi:MAG: dTMP kinase [Candidatus Kapabacteria bacterium]|nr:dTMP kinase [Candidatus Kapabacteria bacterium]